MTSNDITNWLHKPHVMQPAEYVALRRLVQQYPYCSVFHYLLLQERQGNDAGIQELFPANHLLIRQWLLQAWQQQNNVQDELITDPAPQRDYFMEQGLRVPDELPELQSLPHTEQTPEPESEQSLLVMMSFSEWLGYLNAKTQKAREEEEDKKALKTLWQKQKLAAAIEEEDEAIPDQVFAMAVNSIAPHEDIPTEALADVYALQGKRQKAIEMYKKLGLLNPEKNAYFARKIENLQKEI